MIVAMLFVLMVKPSIHQVISVVAVRYRFMAAVRPMDVAVVAFGILAFCAAIRIPVVHLDHMLVHVPLVRVVQMTIVQIIDVPLVADCDMAAIRPVPVGMVTVRLVL